MIFNTDNNNFYAQVKPLNKFRNSNHKHSINVEENQFYHLFVVRDAEKTKNNDRQNRMMFIRTEEREREIFIKRTPGI